VFAERAPELVDVVVVVVGDTNGDESS